MAEIKARGKHRKRSPWLLLVWEGGRWNAVFRKGNDPLYPSRTETEFRAGVEREKDLQDRMGKRTYLVGRVEEVAILKGDLDMVKKDRKV